MEKLKQEEQNVTCNPDILFENRSKNEDFDFMGCDGIWELFQIQEKVIIFMIKIII